MKPSSLFYIAIFSSVFLNSCFNVGSKDYDLKTNIENFILNQSNTYGNVVFKLNSPLATIESNTNNVLATTTDITFYDDNQKPLYKVKSDRSKIIDDSTKIILNGNVILTKLGEHNITMHSEQVTWDSLSNNIVFTGDVLGVMDKSSIRSAHANYLIDQDKMIFNELQEYTIRSDNNQLNVLRVLANSATWDGSTGKLVFNSNNDSVKSKILIPF